MQRLENPIVDDYALVSSKSAPLQAMFDDGRVEGTCCKTIHLSDIFRLAVLSWSVEFLTSLNPTAISKHEP